MALKEIKNYDVAYYAGAKNLSGYPYRAIIGLRDENNALLGAAYFHHSTATMPNSDTQKPTGYISCHYLAEPGRTVVRSSRWQDFRVHGNDHY